MCRTRTVRLRMDSPDRMDRRLITVTTVIMVRPADRIRIVRYKMERTIRQEQTAAQMADPAIEPVAAGKTGKHVFAKQHSLRELKETARIRQETISRLIQLQEVVPTRIDL